MNAQRRFRLRYQTRIALWGFVFALPAVLYLLVFSIFPMLQALLLSFTRYDLIESAGVCGLCKLCSPTLR